MRRSHSFASLLVLGLVSACGSSSSGDSKASTAGSAGAASGGTSAAAAGASAAGATTASGGSAIGGATGNGGSNVVAGAGGASGANAAGAGGGASPPENCGPALPAPTPGASASGPVIQVDVCANRHPISSDIYGVTFWFSDAATTAGNLAFAKDIALPLNRAGGDATTRYNWQVDSSNAGFDFYFMAGSGTTPVPGASNDALVSANQSVGARTILTIPMIEYINKSADTHCSYPKSVYPNQQSYNPYVHPNGDDCGNGKDSSGTVLVDKNIASHDVPNSPDIQKAWVDHLVSKFGTAAKGGVPIYEMDNEPTGWPGIHFDVRPNSPSCEELRDKIQTYAAAVKSADPSAAVLAPDDIPVADDFDCSGPTRGEFVLAAMAAYEKANGTRLLDYYSHHYPGCCSGDPIANALTHIKKHHGWIAAQYPGTKLGYDEYNWGTDVDTYATALLAADGLGLFGRESVDLASFWGLDDATAATGTAFRLYRNYDGKGGRFGDVSISETVSDDTKLHVYAAERSSDNAVTIVVVNKTDGDLTSAVALSNHAVKGAAHVFLFSAANPKAVSAKPDLTIADPGNFTVVFPAASATLIVVP